MSTGGSPESDEMHARCTHMIIANKVGMTTQELENKIAMEETGAKLDGEESTERVKRALAYVKRTPKLNRNQLIAILEGREPVKIRNDFPQEDIDKMENKFRSRGGA